PRSAGEPIQAPKTGPSALPLNAIPEGAILQGPIPQGTIFQGNLPQGTFLQGNLSQGGLMMGSPASIGSANGEAPSLWNRFQDSFTPTNRGNNSPANYWNGSNFRR